MGCNIFLTWIYPQKDQCQTATGHREIFHLPYSIYGFSIEASGIYSVSEEPHKMYPLCRQQYSSLALHAKVSSRFWNFIDKLFGDGFNFSPLTWNSFHIFILFPSVLRTNILWKSMNTFPSHTNPYLPTIAYQRVPMNICGIFASHNFFLTLNDVLSNLLRNRTQKEK